MRWSLLFVVASTVVTVSAAPQSPTLAPNLPAAAFPTFKPIPLEDIKQGKDLKQNKASEDNEGPDVSPNRLANIEDFDLKVAATASCTNPPIRMEWGGYSTANRIAFIASIKCLMGKPASGKFAPAKNRYEDFVRLHQAMMPTVHNNDIFLIWHRYYLWAFEQTLQKECGLKTPMPWWDETKWTGHFSASDMFTDNRYFGAMKAGPNGAPICITNGAFANLVCNIGPGNNNQAHCLSRAVNAGNTGQVSANFVNTCNSRTSFSDMASCSQYGPHAYGHNGIGGVMSDVSASPSDPVFWMHHSFVDHSFRIWQNTGGPVRVNTVNGKDINGKALTMNYQINLGGISGFPTIPISSVMNTQSGVIIGGRTFCYRYNR